MNETREVLGVWTWEGFSKPRNSRHRVERENFIHEYFRGQGEPAYIWRIEFFKLTSPDSVADYTSYGMTLHRFASKNGGRYHTWVKVYDHSGEAVNVRKGATLEPENHRIQAGYLPPEWLLKNWPEPRDDD